MTIRGASGSTSVSDRRVGSEGQESASFILPLVLVQRVRRLLGRSPSGSTNGSALLVAVPEVAGLVRDLHGAAPGEGDLPPHVTVLYPFLSPSDLDRGVLDRLGPCLAAHRAFDFSLSGVDTFPGVVWLVPDPGRPFAQLTEAVLSLWPDLVPYGDPSLTSLPHLTVGRGRLRASWRRTIERALPIEARASEVLLMTEGPDGTWANRARFPLGE